MPNLGGWEWLIILFCCVGTPLVVLVGTILYLARSKKRGATD